MSAFGSGVAGSTTIAPYMPFAMCMSTANALHGVQTVDVPAGGGGVFDVKIDEEGLYPFVSHSFASVDMGQVGLLKVGNPAGTMTH